jgi:hypothetical protein
MPSRRYAKLTSESPHIFLLRTEFEVGSVGLSLGDLIFAVT